MRLLVRGGDWLQVGADTRRDDPAIQDSRRHSLLL
jgi:hypothetical protein